MLNNTQGRKLAQPDVTADLTWAALLKMLLAKVPLGQLMEAGKAGVQGNPQAPGAILGNLEQIESKFSS